MKKLLSFIPILLMLSCSPDNGKADYSMYYNFPELSDSEKTVYLQRLEGVWVMEGPRSTDGLYYFVFTDSELAAWESSNLVDNKLIYNLRKYSLSAKQSPKGEMVRIAFDDLSDAIFFFFDGEDLIRVEYFVLGSNGSKYIQTLGYLRPHTEATLVDAADINKKFVGAWGEIDIEGQRPVSYLKFTEGMIHSRTTSYGDIELKDQRYRFDNHISANESSVDGYTFSTSLYSIHPGFKMYLDADDVLWYNAKYLYLNTRTSQVDPFRYESLGWQKYERLESITTDGF